MPKTRVVFYKDDDSSVPLLEWLGTLEAKAVAKCIVLIDLLRERGHELRRPHADILRDGIHELRARHGTVRLRMLYFFHEKTAVLTHGITKKVAQVPPDEINRAIRFRERYQAGSKAHTHEEG